MPIDKFTALVPCYDGVNRHNLLKKLSYQVFYGTQYLPMKDKLFYNLHGNNPENIINDFTTTFFDSYTPLFSPLIKSLLEAKSIEKVVLFGDKFKLNLALEYEGSNPDIIVLDRNGSLGNNIHSSQSEYDLQRHVFVCMPDVPLVTAEDVDDLINVYLDNSDLNYHDIIAGFVSKHKYLGETSVEKKFIRLKLNDSPSLKSNYYKESCGFLIKVGKINSTVIDQIYNNRKLLLLPQQLASLTSDHMPLKKVQIFGEHLIGRNSKKLLTQRLSEYLGANVNLVLHDIVNFSIDGDSLEDIVELSKAINKK